MDLPRLEKRPAVFEWNGVKIFYRTRLTAGDKYEIDMAGAVVQKDQVSFKPGDFYKHAVRTFVTGWEGVTREGKQVPYSFDELLDLPAESGESLIMNLGYKIAIDVGLIKENTDAKNA